MGTPSAETPSDVFLWKEKYERLLHTYKLTLENNQRLEERLLHISDRTEQEKILLLNEVDHLTEQLTSRDAFIQRLQAESQRYKRDCLLAVSLLQCQPSVYRVSNPSEEENVGGVESDVSLCSGATFPPTAVLMPSSENKRHPDTVPSSERFYNASVGSPLMLKNCLSCQRIALVQDQAVQTEIEGPSLREEEDLIDLGVCEPATPVQLSTRDSSILII